MATKTARRYHAVKIPSAFALSAALDEFVERTLHELVTEGEARQILFCLVEEIASPAGKLWAIRRVRKLAADADVIDNGVRGNGHNSPPASYVARKAERRERDRARTAATKGGGRKKSA